MSEAPNNEEKATAEALTSKYDLELALLDIPNYPTIKILDGGAGIGEIEQAANRLGLDQVKFVLLDFAYDPETRRKYGLYNPMPELRKNTARSTYVAGTTYTAPFRPKSFDFTIFESPFVQTPEVKRLLLERMASLTRRRLVVADPVEPIPPNVIKPIYINNLDIPQTRVFKRAADIMKELNWKLVKSREAPGKLYGGYILSVFEAPEVLAH